MQWGGRAAWRGGPRLDAAGGVSSGVRFLARVLQFIVWVIFATWLGRKLLGWAFGSAMRVGSQNSQSIPSHDVKVLHRDPVCGTHVSPEISVRLTIAGEEHHFCSVTCRERFRRLNSQAASA